MTARNESALPLPYGPPVRLTVEVRFEVGSCSTSSIMSRSSIHEAEPPIGSLERPASKETEITTVVPASPSATVDNRKFGRSGERFHI